jgi:DNA polymerase-3 subunit gamma/tau
MEQFSVDDRPLKFSELYGQTLIVKGLTERFKSGKIPKAFLLRGLYGTGKTTVAQIIAMTLNCTDLQSGDPCGKCSSCRSIMTEAFDDGTIRLDAGSAGKKDDVNDILLNVDVSPFHDKNRIIIIEEADGLTAGAKKALLKVLESPTKNIYFILLSMKATGFEPAIVSRCQVYDFKPFTPSEIMLALQTTLKKKSLWGIPEIPKDFYLQTLRIISETSQGSMRNAMQLLDKCINEKLYDPQDVRNSLHTVDSTTVYECLKDALTLKKDFFEKVRNLDLVQFYDSAYTMLVEAAEYWTTNELRSEYSSEAQVSGLSKEGNLWKLKEVFDTIFSSSPYMREQFILSQFTTYFMNNQILVVKPILSEQKSVKRIYED